ncbi:NACHT, LRR and PYD domains-containing protein 3-like [Engraulis encrasicolus]|uniref:NACHT, LRR and PYD domains-containing protein 3-like n=1 Tax=Engraulis encrasicolus TaxID=184585 RepID=UPI002FD04B88
MSSPGNQESQLGQESAGQSEESHRHEPRIDVSSLLSKWNDLSKGSGVSSAPSMRSDRSKDHAPDLTESGSRAFQVDFRKEPMSGVSRAPSMRSDRSKDQAPDLAEEDRSLVPSAPSMRSDRSKDHAPDLADEESAPSMRSNRSKDHAPDLTGEDRELEWRCEQETSDQDKQQDLPHIFKVLEVKIITFVKNELQRFKQILSPDYQEHFEMKSEEESDAREGVLKMAVHFLCKMKHQDLANTLNENEMNVCCQNGLKRNLKNKYQNVFEGIAKHGNSVLLQKIYTDLYITEGGSGKVNEEHEVRQIESRCKRPAGKEKPFKCADVFKPSSSQDKPVRRVLTKGVAGIGKTISVHKYILDWAEGNDNQEINFIFPLSFRELNIIKDKDWSFMDLLHYFFPELKHLSIGNQKKYNVLFVFDGLDECRLQLNFQGNESCTDMTVNNSLGVLLTNLLKGNMFPSALLWITSRPAAVGKIPPDCVDLVTEVQGFNDSQKEEYFGKKISDESLARRTILHIKSSRSLHIMCHIPVFCWIAATVLEMIFSLGSTNIPKTLTEMYTYFLTFQTRQKNTKFDNVHGLDPQWNHELVLNLGKLAYEQLQKGNLIFYEEDLTECGIDVSEAAVYSGMCSQLFREESGILLGSVFCFVHLTIQEYLAALYALLMAVESKDIISTPCSPTMAESMIILQKSAVDKALAHEDGRFDLFLRFLLGLSLESNQSLLHGLLQRRQEMGNDDTIRYIKEKIKDASSSERMINLFYCLNELNDHSLMDEIQSFLTAGTLAEAQLSPGQWSALVFVLLTSDQNLDVFDLKKYVRSDEALLRLKSVIEESHTTLVNNCGLTEESCTTLASILCKESSKLRSLDLSDNHIGDIGVKTLSTGLENPNCALETLRIESCSITEEGSNVLTSALISNPSHLIELYLGSNKLGDSGVKQLSNLLRNEDCKLQKLGLRGCNMTKDGCVSVLTSNPSHLTVLDLSKNELGDSGVKQISALFRNPDCKLQELCLESCDITEEGCADLTSALTSNPLHLIQLYMGGNKLGDLGVKQISALLQNTDSKLQTLGLSDCGVTGEGYAALASALKSNPSCLEELDLRGNDPGHSEVKLLTDLLQEPVCKLQRLSLSDCGVTGEGYAALAVALKSNPSHLEELDLRGNDPGHSEVKLLIDLLQDPTCKLQRLSLSDCGVTGEGYAALAVALKSNPSHLEELDLRGNDPGHSEVKLLIDLLEDPTCKLQRLSLSGCGVTGEGYAALAAALKSNPSHLEELDLRGNDPGHSEVKLLTDLLGDPAYKLQRLRLLASDEADEALVYLTSVHGGNPLMLTELDLRGKITGDSGVKQLCPLLEDSHCRLTTIKTSR